MSLSNKPAPRRALPTREIWLASEDDIHTAWCDCALCRANALREATVWDHLNSVAIQVLAGFGVGLALCAAIDRLTGGPGLLAVFGL